MFNCVILLHTHVNAMLDTYGLHKCDSIQQPKLEGTHYPYFAHHSNDADASNSQSLAQEKLTPWPDNGKCKFLTMGLGPQ